MFRKIISGVFAVATIVMSATNVQAGEELRIGVEANYPPFSMKESDGHLTGFDIEIARALCAEMKRDCVFVESDWDGIIPALNSQKFDAIIASMGITPDRMKVVDFTNKYYVSETALLAPKDTGITSADKAGTAGKNIGVQRGTAHECYIEKHMPDAEMKQYPTTEEIYIELENTRLDAIVVDTIPGLEWLKKDGNSEKFVSVATNLYDVGCFGEGIGIAIRKGENELREAFNTAIKGIRASGAYKKVNDMYFDVDIYGAD